MNTNPETQSKSLDWTTALLFWAMFAVACASSLFVSPLAERSHSDAFQAAAIGAFVAIAPLSAFWVVLAPLAFQQRISLGLFLAFAVSSAYAAGEDRATAAGTIIGQFALACLSLAVLRRPFRWRLRCCGEPVQTSKSDWWFTLPSILLWTLEIAAFLAFLQYLTRSGEQPKGRIAGPTAFA